MSTTALTLSSSLFGIGFRSTYVSDALNAVLGAVLTPGIWRGFSLAPASGTLRVQLEVDAVDGDSVAVYRNSNGRALVTRLTATSAVIDLAAYASQSVVIALIGSYSTGSTSNVYVIVYTEAEWALSAENGYGVVLGRVAVPASGTIATTDISYYGRTYAFQRTSLDSSWVKLLDHSSFQAVWSGAASGYGDGNKLIGWTTSPAAPANWTFATSTTYAKSGGRSMKATIPNANESVYMLPGAKNAEGNATVAMFAVAPSDELLLECWVRPDTVVNATATLSIITVQIDGTTAATAITGTALPVTGASFQQVLVQAKAPANCAFIYPAILFDADVGGSGAFYVDDVQLYVRPRLASAARSKAFVPVAGPVIALRDPARSRELVMSIDSSNDFHMVPAPDGATRNLKIGKTSSLLNVTVKGNITADTGNVTGVDGVFTGNTRVTGDAQGGNVKLQQDSHAMSLSSSVQLIDNAASGTPAADYVTWTRTINGFALKPAPWSTAASLSGSPSSNGGPYANNTANLTNFVIDVDELLASAGATDASSRSTLEEAYVVVTPRVNSYTGGTTFVTLGIYTQAFLIGFPGAAAPTLLTGSVATINGTTLNGAHPNAVSASKTGLGQAVYGSITAGTKAFVVVSITAESGKEGPELIAIELRGKTYRIAPN